MYKFLLIEDNEGDIESCKDTLERINSYSESRIDMDYSRSFDEAMKTINPEYDGIIVDIRLNESNGGNEIIRHIIEKYRMPVAVMTGTPDTDLEEGSPIRIYTKGKDSYEDIFNDLKDLISTGLFNVIGLKGTIEKLMNDVFWNSLYPLAEVWKEKKKNGKDTEKCLLRYAIAHLQELINHEMPEHLTEEMYIMSPVNLGIKTGSIVHLKSNPDTNYIVLSPPCDLALHGGCMKTDRILLCQIEQFMDIHIHGDTQKSKNNELKKYIKNIQSGYYHWLPKNSLFEGGIINFRKVSTYSPDELASNFDPPLIKLQDYFVKDVLCRFSAYYSRQGQPDFDIVDEFQLASKFMSTKT